MSDTEVYYSTNWMGPISKEWVDKNGPFWSGGRIDIRGPGVEKDNPYGLEYGLDIMFSEHWNQFTEWLNTYVTDGLVPLNKILEDYPGYILWWKEG